MTLNKAIKELYEELNRTDLTEEEKKALDKYKTWLCSIKATVSNNTPYWHPYPLEKPQKPLEYYLVTLLFEDGYKLVTDMMTVEDATFGDDSIVIAWAELPKPFDARFWV